MKHKKKILLLFIIGLISFFSEKIFPALAGIFILLIILILVIEVVLDVYIIIAIILQNDNKKKKI